MVEAPLRARIYFGRGKAEEVRRALLTALVLDLAPDGLARLVLDSRDRVGDHAERASGGDTFGFAHLRSHEEPALWVPDVVAWCWGAGGEWRRRIDSIIDHAREVG
ncbi:hypothetical protein L6E12_17685 [Actinokineospora sp. PR83]|uniref:hypothetical protein n=1 Tax=Actinokineospora sp. PR83 TaxID=2884908 RepID=UPI001F1FB258|nr:hypothetical protein [Actinokineospora sp. PR83]MCG8917617.1 hypothetical protein [Actinokineospora sp. PR83]